MGIVEDQSQSTSSSVPSCPKAGGPPPPYNNNVVVPTDHDDNESNLHDLSCSEKTSRALRAAIVANKYNISARYQTYVSHIAETSYVVIADVSGSMTEKTSVQDVVTKKIRYLTRYEELLERLEAELLFLADCGCPEMTIFHFHSPDPLVIQTENNNLHSFGSPASKNDLARSVEDSLRFLSIPLTVKNGKL